MLACLRSHVDHTQVILFYNTHTDRHTDRQRERERQTDRETERERDLTHLRVQLHSAVFDYKQAMPRPKI